MRWTRANWQFCEYTCVHVLFLLRVPFVCSPAPATGAGRVKDAPGAKAAGARIVSAANAARSATDAHVTTAGERLEGMHAVW